MKRLTAALIAATAIGVLAAPAVGASERRSTLDSYCSPTGDYCLGIKYKPKGGRVKLEISSLAFSGPYKLCVRGPQQKNCKQFSLTESGDGYADKVDWESNFGTQGDGTYLVTWKLNGTKLGKTLGFKFG
ncbi:MAG: hypothetical protein ACHQJ5_10025 [Vicinamibacteria bacterium]|jgi:hypothetical protein